MPFTPCVLPTSHRLASERCSSPTELVSPGCSTISRPPQILGLGSGKHHRRRPAPQHAGKCTGGSEVEVDWMKMLVPSCRAHAAGRHPCAAAVPLCRGEAPCHRGSHRSRTPGVCIPSTSCPRHGNVRGSLPPAPRKDGMMTPSLLPLVRPASCGRPGPAGPPFGLAPACGQWETWALSECRCSAWNSICQPCFPVILLCRLQGSTDGPICRR